MDPPDVTVRRSTARARNVLWLEPELVVEVTYAEVMQGRLRDPVFRNHCLPPGLGHFKAT